MIGTRIAGRYDIEEQIGIGGMGVVYRAHDTRLMRRVALKVIAPHLIQQENARSQFLREAQALAGLMHPNIVTVFDLCDDEATQTVFIIMELLRGNSLRHSMTSPTRPLFSQLALPLCRALEAAHAQGFLHRDIKPENVFVCDDGTIKLMDFGLARLLTANSRSQASLLAGTLAYMAPEQLKGEKADFRADLYSLGILFYEFLSGVTPFEADNPGAILLKHLTEPAPPLRNRVPTIAPQLEAVIHRLLEKEPSARFDSATALRATLEQTLPESSLTLAQVADKTGPTEPTQSAPTLVGMVTAETPTPVLASPTVAAPKSAPSIFRQPGGKVKPAFLAGGVACFGAAALLFVGPAHRYFEPASGGEPAHSAKQTPAVVTALTQQANATPTPVAPPNAPQAERKEAESSQKHTRSELDELIKQQEQTRSEVERLEKLIASSEEKRKAAETRAAVAETTSADRSLPKTQRPAFSHGPIVTVPGVNTFPMIPGMKMPPQSRRQMDPLPLGLPAALVQIASLRPHDQFEFRTRPVTRMPDGTLQVEVHNAKPCYVYFYTLDDARNQAVFLPSGERRLSGEPQRNGFTGIGLHLNDSSAAPVKLLMLASVKPLFGLPPSFTLPDAPKRPQGDVPPDSRFALLHDYRDLIVTMLQANRVQEDGKGIQQDDLIVRFLRSKPTVAGTPPLATPPTQRRFGRNRPAPAGTRVP